MSRLSLLDAAVRYAKTGWHVFPLGARSKYPAITGGRGFQDATDDAARIEKWWMKNPTHNIGIATGASGLYVVDVDGERGEESLRSLVEEHGELPETLTSKTGKGYHYFFKLPDDSLSNSASKLGPGIDTRGMGGYVVAAPSIHPDGHRYEWLNEGISCAQLPEWIAKTFEKVAWIPPTYIPSAYSVNVHPYVRSVWENCQSAFQSSMPGRRNHDLNVAANKMGHWIASGSISRDRVEQELREIARALGLTDSEIEGTLRSGIEAGLREPMYPPEAQPFQHENKHQQAARQVEGTITIARGSTFGRKEVKYVWGQRVPIGKLTVLAGPSGIGKSFISLALAAHVTAGMPLLDCGKGKLDGEVLFCSYEDDVEDSIGPRADLLGVDMDRCHFITGVDTEHGRRQFGPQDVPRIIDYLKTCPEINLVVIDPLGSFLGSGTDGNSETEARAVLGTLVEAAAQTQTAVIIVAHFNKGTEHSDPLHRIAGSQGITALPRSVMVVEWGEDKERLVKHIKSSTSAEASTVGYRFEDGKFTWTRLVREPAEAATWLRGEIETSGGSLHMTEIFRRAKIFGLDDNEIDVARNLVNPTILTDGKGSWVWEL